MKHNIKCKTTIIPDILEFDSNYVNVYILQLNQTNGTKSEVYILTEASDTPLFELNLDGFYTLVTLKVPRDPDNEYYFQDGKFYHFSEEIDLQTLVESSEFQTTYKYYFQTSRLRSCYINVCYLIFDLVATINCPKPIPNQELIYKRDLLWAALNTIKYMAENDLFEEAERLLERITGCNGLCNNLLDKYNDCGCL